MIRFTVPGQPQGKGRAKAARRKAKGGGEYVALITPEKTVAYEGLIAYAAQQAMNGDELIDRPVYLTVQAFFAFPKAMSGKKKAARDVHWHTGRPDTDNIVKAVGDALNGVVWRDDTQVALVKASKQYDETPRLEITVEALP